MLGPQHDFIAPVVEHLTANGAMEPARLYEAPFTDVAAGGPEAIFKDADVDERISAIKRVRQNAVPREDAA